MFWLRSSWLPVALLAFCGRLNALFEEYDLSLSSYHLCIGHETRQVSSMVTYPVAYTQRRPCGGWLPWKTCDVRLYKMVHRTEYGTVTEEVTRCCDGFVQVGRYCALPLSRSSEFATKAGSCPATGELPSDSARCHWDWDCPRWQKCCRTLGTCAEPTNSSHLSNGGWRFNVTVTVKTDYLRLISLEERHLNHTRLLHAMVTGALNSSDVTVRYIGTWPVDPYRTATSLLVESNVTALLSDTRSSLSYLIREIEEVSSVTVEDVDECAHPALHTCCSHAACNNTVGSYRCACHQGYVDVDPTKVGTGSQTLNATAKLTNVEFTDDLLNSSSQAYINLTKSIMNEVYGCLLPNLRAMVDSGMARITITSLSQGSVVVNFTISFDTTEVQDVSQLSLAVVSSLLNSTKYTLDVNSIHISDIATIGTAPSVTTTTPSVTTTTPSLTTTTPSPTTTTPVPSTTTTPPPTTTIPSVTTTTPPPTTTTITSPSTTLSSATTTTSVATMTTPSPPTATPSPPTATPSPTTTTSPPTTTTPPPTTTTPPPTTTTITSPSTTLSLATTTTSVATMTTPPPTTTTPSPPTATPSPTTTTSPPTMTTPPPTTTTPSPPTATPSPPTTTPSPTMTTPSPTTTTATPPPTTTITPPTAASSSTIIPAATVAATSAVTSQVTPGAISVQCRATAITVSVALGFLTANRITEDALYLGLKECSVNGGNATHAQLTVAWNECDTKILNNETYYTVQVMLFNSMEPQTLLDGTVLVPRMHLALPIMCTYRKTILISTNYGPTGYDILGDAITGLGTFHVTVQLLNGTWPLPQNYSLSPTDKVVLEVSLNTSAPQIKVVMDTCWATPTSNPTDAVKNVFLQNSCPLPGTYTTVLQNGNFSTSRLSVQIFAFVDMDVLYIHCQVQICVELGSHTCVPECIERTGRSSNSIGTGFGSSGPLQRLYVDSLQEGMDTLHLVGFSFLGIGLSLIFVGGFIGIFFCQRNRIGNYNFNLKPKEEKFTYLVFNT